MHSFVFLWKMANVSSVFELTLTHMPGLTTRCWTMGWWVCAKRKEFSFLSRISSHAAYTNHVWSSNRKFKIQTTKTEQTVNSTIRAHGLRWEEARHYELVCTVSSRFALSIRSQALHIGRNSNSPPHHESARTIPLPTEMQSRFHLGPPVDPLLGNRLQAQH